MSETPAITRETQLASATPKDQKPKWYHIVFLVFLIGSIILLCTDRAGSGLGWVILGLSLIMAGMCWWNYHVNGNIFDDRSGGH